VSEAGASRAEAIVESLRGQILNGRYWPGDRLPSERELSERLIAAASRNVVVCMVRNGLTAAANRRRDTRKKAPRGAGASGRRGRARGEPRSRRRCVSSA
jgi:DNA-binding transcriptional MocR family regulator